MTDAKDTFHQSVQAEREYHVGAEHPLKTISSAAALAQPGDTITVHAGVYRERIDPPRGGTSDAKRITYRAAEGERVVITGAEPMKGWEKVGADTWKVVLPNAYFGDFNPFSHRIEGEWCQPTGRHAGSVYLNGEWLHESLSLDPVLRAAGEVPMWFAEVGGSSMADGKHLFSIKSLKVGGQEIAAIDFTDKSGEVCAVLEHTCIGCAHHGDWVSYEGIDLSKTQDISIEASALEGSVEIEFHAGLGTAEAEFLGQVTVRNTGGWRAWETFAAPLRASSFPANKSLFMVFKPGVDRVVAGDNTTIWAQFPGLNPNEADVEISKRQSVFYPSKIGINHITVRGFELCRAATPWGGAMSEQVGLIGTHWSKGWIIEDNHIHHSMCKGVSLGRYELPKGERPPETAPGFVQSMELALRDGWSKETIGGHIVRNNQIHDCEKNAIHGSLGAAFSEISGNEIHDIARTGWVRGPDTSGIKFLGGVDMKILNNHIHDCGGHGGIWLDWSCQGASVLGNLLYDNEPGDVFLEMQHGPLLVANNILLSACSFSINSEGMALVHNLIAGEVKMFSDPRETPFHPAHAVSIEGLYAACGGDHRIYNNLLSGPLEYIDSGLPGIEHGNSLLGESKWRVVRKADGWYLPLPVGFAAAPCVPVTTDLLGKAAVSGCAYENVDGTPLNIDTDYFGHPRDAAHPGVGPFAGLKAGQHEIKVWPK